MGYFMFPRNKPLRDVWLKTIGNPLLQGVSYENIRYKYCVCGIHFDTSQFQTMERAKLNRGAIPSLQIIHSPDVTSEVKDTVSTHNFQGNDI